MVRTRMFVAVHIAAQVSWRASVDPRFTDAAGHAAAAAGHAAAASGCLPTASTEHGPDPCFHVSKAHPVAANATSAALIDPASGLRARNSQGRRGPSMTRAVMMAAAASAAGPVWPPAKPCTRGLVFALSWNSFLF